MVDDGYECFPQRQPPGALVTVSTSVGFVGRQRELRILGDRLAAAALGHPQVVYVEGEAGGGKSTLLSRFLGSLTNAVVLEVSGDEAETLLSYRSEERRVGKECRSRWSPYH